MRDDLGRFAIIVKVPSKGDRWTCRNEDDLAITYILDSAFTGFVSKNRMPKWFIEAIK